MTAENQKTGWQKGKKRGPLSAYHRQRISEGMRSSPNVKMGQRIRRQRENQD